MVLRETLGEVLRWHRMRQRRTLREVSAAARVSLGYLSEIERGQKEASSELLAAICVALGVRMSEVLRDVSDHLALEESTVAGVPERLTDEPVPLERGASNSIASGGIATEGAVSARVAA